jgi:hypothetical protein
LAKAVKVYWIVFASCGVCRADCWHLFRCNGAFCHNGTRNSDSDDLEKRALSLGFQPVEIDQAMYLIVDGYLAPDYVNLAPLPETVKTVPANLPPDFTESLFDWLGQNVLPPVDQVLGVKP